ncbi:MAG: hypothetical protein ACHQ1D_00315 [Nitrososphaerales archaeon]
MNCSRFGVTNIPPLKDWILEDIIRDPDNWNGSIQVTEEDGSILIRKFENGVLTLVTATNKELE